MNNHTPVIEDLEYVEIWQCRAHAPASSEFCFAVTHNLEDTDCAYEATDLTAEEVGQLMGGS